MFGDEIVGVTLVSARNVTKIYISVESENFLLNFSANLVNFSKSS